MTSMAANQRHLKANSWIALSILAMCFVQIASGQVGCPARCRRCSGGEVSCDNMSLTAPPKAYPVNTTRINLENNHLRVLGSRTFDTSLTLEILLLSNNKLTTLRPDSFSSFPNLMSLDLTGNQISSISRRTFLLQRELKSLVLNRNRLSGLEFLEDARGLQQLSLGQNKLKAIRENDLAQLTLLHSLDLSDNQISSIHPRAFNNLRHLRILYLNKNPLVNTPQFQFTSESLQLVDISQCQLTAVPGPFPASVLDLRIGNNKISRVQLNDLRNITELQLLGLNDNELTVVEDGALSHLNNLKELWLRGNSLVYIPRNLPNSVTKLHMDTNHLQEIELGVFNNQSRLEYLSVESNALRRILPNTFRGLPFLNTINFQGNPIEVIETGAFDNMGSASTILLASNPEMRKIENGAFRNMANLTRLHLSYLSREEFQLEGNFLLQMLRLQTLDMMGSPGLADAFMAMVDNPELTRVPLQSLTRLDLSFNNLRNVSQRVRTIFPNLNILLLDQNPFSCTRDLKWLKDWIVSDRIVQFSQYEDLKCNSPARLYGRTLRSLRDNEWGNNDEIETDRLLGRTGVELELADEAALSKNQPKNPTQVSPNVDKREKNQENKNKKQARQETNKNKKPKKPESKQDVTRKAKKGKDKSKTNSKAKARN